MMTEEKQNPQVEPKASPVLNVAPGPHLQDTSLTTRWMMLDVLIAMIPMVALSCYFFDMWALRQCIICVGSCMAAESIFTLMRNRPLKSASLLAGIVTGLILAMSLPAAAPDYIGVIGSFVAIGIGKIIFGGLGYNLFNPAMVGRAFVMLAFSKSMGGAAYAVKPAVAKSVDVLTQATPMTSESATLWELLLGTTNGSLGEVSALACILGGLYLCLRRTAAWQIPAGVLLAVAVIAGGVNLANMSSSWGVLHQLLGGALLFGAFFIATDPVTSPVTGKGKFIFGLGVGALVMMIRVLSNYPEGVMFAVLLMNALTPLINRWCVPKPFGGGNKA